MPMKRFRRIRQWLRKHFGKLANSLKAFQRDLTDKLYEKTVDRLAAILLVLLLGIFLYLTGGRTTDYIQEAFIEDARVMRSRQLHGQILDAKEDVPLPSVKVAAVDQNQAPVFTDENGVFTLSFQAHKDSTHFTLSLSKPGYKPRNKPHSIPLNRNAEKELQYFTLQPK
jgi:hypothetical protein